MVTLVILTPAFLIGTLATTIFREVTVIARLENQEVIGGTTVIIGIDN